jgi:V/A-type H+/Na+-transporting ATPase subunit I
MLKPAEMEQFNLLVLDSDVERVALEIIKLGVVHLHDISEVEKWADTQMTRVHNEDSLRLLESFEGRIKTAMEKLKLDLKILPENITAESVNTGEIQQQIEMIEDGIQQKTAARQIARERLERLKEMRTELRESPVNVIDLKEAKRFRFLDMVLGKVDEDTVDVLQRGLVSLPHVILPFDIAASGKKVVMILVMKRDRPVLDRLLRNISIEKIESAEKPEDFSQELDRNIDSRIIEAEDDVVKAEAALAATAKKYQAPLEELLRKAGVNRLLLKAKGYFKKTERAYLISGWVPAYEHEKLVETIRECTSNRFIKEDMPAEELERFKSGEVNVPVKFQNPKFLRPFEMVVSNFSLPAYNTIDPTIIVAITFLLMFGVMFGDVGQGSILAAFGGFMMSRKKFTEAVRRIGTLILYCGISSIIFGFLFGSVFGFEELIPTLWLKPTENTTQLMILAVLFGAALISVGIILNIINSIKRKRHFDGIFSKTGLVGGLIYWICIGLAIKATTSAGAISTPVALALLLPPLLLLFFREPIKKLFNPGERIFEHGVFTYIIESLMELFELFLGYLANTISFIRVAAFALSHAALFLAIFAVTDSLPDTVPGNFATVLIHIFGNILIILLEGMIVTIQCIRLEYYEFFSKFYEGGGSRYQPIGLHELTGKEIAS